MVDFCKTVLVVMFAFFLTVFVSSAASADTSERRAFQPGVHRTGKYKIDEKKVFANRDLSGIACISDSHCVIASDEGVYIQVCTLSREDKTIVISGKESSKIAMQSPSVGSEIDIEAVTAIGDTYYIMGSHGVAKNSGRFLSPRHTCFRMKIDPETGKQAGKVEESTVMHVLAADSALRRYYGVVLQQRGINIEGLAAKDGMLYVGFRSPSLNGNAHVIEIAPDELFKKDREKAYTMHTVPLGNGIGIREMVAIDSGFLIVSGNAGSEPGDSRDPDTKANVKDFEPNRPFSLVFWNGDDGIQKIGEIPTESTGHNVEAMLVLSDTDESIELLMLCDGPAGGNPTVYQIHKVRQEREPAHR